MIVNDVERPVKVKADGEIKDWVTFGEEKTPEFNLSPTYFTNIILVTVSVPKDAELEALEGNIIADDKILSKLQIKVTVELNDAKAYSQLSDVDKEVGQLRDSVESFIVSLNEMRFQMATLEEEVSQKMKEIAEYQKNLTILEKQNKELSAKNQELTTQLTGLQSRASNLEEHNNELSQLTGMLIGDQMPGLFFGGIALGVIALTLGIHRNSIRKRIRSRANNFNERVKGERFRYKFSK
jgi:DNA repair exonuclease SbcCD ATPase subunit